MKKQILTKGIIERELLLKLEKFKRAHVKHALPYSLLIISVVIFFTILVTINRKLDALGILLIVLIGLAIALLLVNIIGASCDYLHLKRALKFRLYNLEIDQLNSKQRRSIEIDQSGFFYFRKHGMTTDLNSEFFKTFDVDVYDVAEQLDLFYLVVYKKQILCIYNTRFYALDEELQKELRT